MGKIIDNNDKIEQQENILQFYSWKIIKRTELPHEIKFSTNNVDNWGFRKDTFTICSDIWQQRGILQFKVKVTISIRNIVLVKHSEMNTDKLAFQLFKVIFVQQREVWP